MITVPDNRWGRVDIKTTGLLSNVLARQAALERGARDAWFVDADGMVTEASSANVWIVTPAGTLMTRHADHAILRGITRTVLFDAIKAQGLVVQERAFTVEEAYSAREAFITSASQIVLPVVRVDGQRLVTVSRVRWRQPFGALITFTPRRIAQTGAKLGLHRSAPGLLIVGIRDQFGPDLWDRKQNQKASKKGQKRPWGRGLRRKERGNGHGSRPRTKSPRHLPQSRP